MSALRFIHAADLHLDSPFTGLSTRNERVAALARESSFGAWDALVGRAVGEKVDFLLVAGDVFDSATRSLRAQLRFRGGLEKLAEAGIQSFVVHGNHDPLDGWAATLEWPEAVHIFSGERVESAPVLRDGEEVARVWGISYPTREVRNNLAALFERDRGTRFAVALLHCNLGSDTGHEPYAPCRLGDLENAGFDYWALGHVHKARQYELGGGALAVYPGNIQGRHPGETGPRGARLVTRHESGALESEFVETDMLRWERLEQDIDGTGTVDRLVERIEEAVAGLGAASEGRTLCLRISLIGRGELHSSLARTGELESLREALQDSLDPSGTRVWLERLDDLTRPPVDIEARGQGDDFLATLLREFDSIMGDLPGKEQEVLDALGDLYGNRDLRSCGIERPGREELSRLLDRARTICIDRLAGDD